MNALRRVTLASAALAISACVLRPQVSSAVLSRGDALAYWGQRDGALAEYRKALALDGSNGVAVDRYVFGAALSGKRQTLEDGVRVAERFLERHPADGVVLMDLALCFQHMRDYSSAALAFQRAGAIRRDARALLFAALDEKRLHHRAQERALLFQAISTDPGFIPAAAALAKAR